MAEPSIRRIGRLFALLCAAPLGHCVAFGQRAGVQPVSRGGGPERTVARAAAPPRAEEVLDVTRTEDTVDQLNAVQFDSRCHSVTTDPPPAIDPFALVEGLLEPLGSNVRAQLDHTESPTLRDSAQHFFGAGRAREGKRVRPVIVLLIGAATALSAPQGARPEPDAAAEASGEHSLPNRRQLAAITEMIHTASLIHDDVLDAADTRRGDSAVHRLYSTKAAVLSGDFLLARASVMLARMNNAQVVREMSKSLEALVQGELMQLRSTPDERLSLEYYLTKSYCKTASLMAYSCKSAALLSGHAIESGVAVAAEKFGYHFGLAFQVIDDLLDFTATDEQLGKPGLQDMSLGLSTAPVLYAAEEYPELKQLILRKFEAAGDVEAACGVVMKSAGLRRTKELAAFHAQAAVDACCTLPPCEERDGLVRLCHVVLSRSS
mmetsp:Transcript_481/g.1423  ORF Transcript_481/g.1423 Transcript_481/m.1423 type:complete len:434 (-) Transcript_481:22-1323(-)